MARKLISREDVFNAANDLQASGKRPTILGVYKLLGRGSYTTITNYLKQWEKENPNAEIVEDVELPEVIANDANVFVGKLWNIAKNHADAQVQAERDALRARELELNEETQQAVDIANEHSERIESLEEQLEAARQDASTLGKSLDASERQVLVLETELKNASGNLAQAVQNGQKLDLENEALKRQTAEDGANLKVAHERIRDLEADSMKLQAEIRRQADALSHFQGQIDAKDQIIADLYAKLEKQQRGLFTPAPSSDK
ncbi:MAG: DNA-binding protein [Acidovorax sp.]|nr:DNA-binding protein [Acidovorax sp.]